MWVKRNQAKQQQSSNQVKKKAIKTLTNDSRLFNSKLNASWEKIGDKQKQFKYFVYLLCLSLCCLLYTG